MGGLLSGGRGDVGELCEGVEWLKCWVVNGMVAVNV